MARFYYHLRCVIVIVSITFAQIHRAVAVKLRPKNAIRASNEIVTRRTNSIVLVVARLIEHSLKILARVLKLQIRKVHQNDDTFRRACKRETMVNSSLLLGDTTSFTNRRRRFRNRSISNVPTFLRLTKRCAVRKRVVMVKLITYQLYGQLTPVRLRHFKRFRRCRYSIYADTQPATYNDSPYLPHYLLCIKTSLDVPRTIWISGICFSTNTFGSPMPLTSSSSAGGSNS